MLHRVIVLPSAGLIDRVLTLLFGWHLATPFSDIFRQVRSTWSLLHPLPPRMILIWIHAARWCMDDKYPLIAGSFQDLVHTWGHLFRAPYGVETVMCVPHVADDYRSLIRNPRFNLVAHRVFA